MDLLRDSQRNYKWEYGSPQRTQRSVHRFQCKGPRIYCWSKLYQTCNRNSARILVDNLDTDHHDIRLCSCTRHFDIARSDRKAMDYTGLVRLGVQLYLSQ